MAGLVIGGGRVNLDPYFQAQARRDALLERAGALANQQNERALSHQMGVENDHRQNIAQLGTERIAAEARAAALAQSAQFHQDDVAHQNKVLEQNGQLRQDALDQQRQFHEDDINQKNLNARDRALADASSKELDKLKLETVDKQRRDIAEMQNQSRLEKQMTAEIQMARRGHERNIQMGIAQGLPPEALSEEAALADQKEAAIRQKYAAMGPQSQESSMFDDINKSYFNSKINAPTQPPPMPEMMPEESPADAAPAPAPQPMPPAPTDNPYMQRSKYAQAMADKKQAEEKAKNDAQTQAMKIRQERWDAQQAERKAAHEEKQKPLRALVSNMQEELSQYPGKEKEVLDATIARLNGRLPSNWFAEGAARNPFIAEEIAQLDALEQQQARATREDPNPYKPQPGEKVWLARHRGDEKTMMRNAEMREALRNLVAQKKALPTTRDVDSVPQDGQTPQVEMESQQAVPQSEPQVTGVADFTPEAPVAAPAPQPDLRAIALSPQRFEQIVRGADSERAAMLAALEDAKRAGLKPDEAKAHIQRVVDSWIMGNNAKMRSWKEGIAEAQGAAAAKSKKIQDDELERRERTFRYTQGIGRDTVDRIR